MNGGFCQRPFDCCVQRHTAHCGRSTSGARARGSFARSPWCVVGLLVLHDCPPDENGDGELVAAARRLRLSSQTEFRRRDRSRSGFTGSGSSSGSAAAAAAAPLPDDGGWCGAALPRACFGGGIRTRSAGVILPRNSVITGNTAMILPIQLAVSSPKAPRMRPVIGLVQHQTAVVVGEPEHEFLFLAAVPLEHFFGDGFDAEFLYPA